MAVSAVITPGKIFTDGEAVTVSELNKLGAPTVDISGAVGSLSLADGSVTNAKVAAGTGVQLDKLETGSDAQVIVANSSGEGVWVAVSGDATVDNAGAVTLATAITNAVAPAGGIMQYAGTSAPTGWLFCYGSAKDSDADTTLAALFTAIGTTYGGTGSDAFNLPDLRGRIPMGTNDAGLPNGLLTSDTARPTERNEGDDGGTETHTLVASEMPAHNHNLAGANGNTTPGASDISSASDIIAKFWTHSGSTYQAYGLKADSATDATLGKSSTTGSGTAHTITQPFVVVNFIIKT